MLSGGLISCLYFNPMYRHKADKLAIKLQLDLVEPLKNHGTNRFSESDNRVDNVKSTVKGGNSTDYLLAKIKRDRPDIAQRLADGEYLFYHKWQNRQKMNHF